MTSWKLLGGDDSHLNDIHSVLESRNICVCREVDWRDDVSAIQEHLKQYIWEVPTVEGCIFSRAAEHIVDTWMQSAVMQDVSNWLPIRSISTPNYRRTRRVFQDFDRLAQDCWYLPHERSFFWVICVHQLLSCLQKRQLVLHENFGVGRVLDIFRCPDGVPAGVQFPVMALMEFGEFQIDNDSHLQRRPSACIRQHVSITSLHLLPAAAVILDDRDEGDGCRPVDILIFQISVGVGALQAALRIKEAELWLPIITFSDDLNTNCVYFVASDL